MSTLVAPAWARSDRIATLRQQLPAEVRTPPLWWAPNGSRVLCENLQITGSYKIRAAFTVLQSFGGGKGMALSSSGNFAIAFAYAGHCLGIPISVVMMHKSSSFKAALAEKWGARIVRCGDHIEDRIATLKRLRDEEGWTMVDHLEDPLVIAGHATLGHDLADACAPDQVLVPVSTAGLAAGVALAVKQRYPHCRVIGVQSQGSDAAAQSFRARRSVTLDRIETECDALTANRPGGLPLSVCLDWLDDIITVEETFIRKAVLELLQQAHLLVEPGGAVGYAALLQGLAPASSVVVLSGGNLDLTRLQAWA